MASTSDATLQPNERFGAVEGGGTKFVCAIGRGSGQIELESTVATTTPQETLASVINFFRQAPPVASIGVGMFGPIDLHGRTSGDPGTTLDTPKPNWSGVAVRRTLAAALNVPVVVDTDVNSAALAEWMWGAGQGCDPLLYVTVGTGIGGGIIVNGRPIHGALHPEIGHIPVPRLLLADGTPDPFDGICPFHARCIEGVASGKAFDTRIGQHAHTLAAEDPLWEVEARYLAHLVSVAMFCFSPQRIVIGGGLMQGPTLLKLVREHVGEFLGGYLPIAAYTTQIEHTIVYPHFGQRAGLVGGLALAASTAPSKTATNRSLHD